MIASGNYLYISAGKTGLDIFDISNPRQPVRKGNLPPPQGGHANDIYVKDNTAYVATAEGKLQVVDVSNPSSPNSAGIYSGGFFVVQGVTGFENYISIVGYKKQGSLEFNAVQILDISNPTSPTLVSEYIHNIDPKPEGVGMFDFAISVPAFWSQNSLLVADNNFGLRVFNIGSFSQPTTLAETGKLFTFGEVRDGCASGNDKIFFELYAGNN